MSVKPPNEKRLKDFFLMTPEMWMLIFNHQEGKCAICGNPLEKTNKKGNPSPIHTDHDHKTGQIRGLLCFRCNSVLGEIMTLPFVRKVLAYLENLPATAALGAPHYGLPGRTGTKKQRALLRKMRVAPSEPLMETNHDC